MAMNEVLEQYAPSPPSAPESRDCSMQSSFSSVAKPAKTVPAYYPPSEKMSDSVMARDASSIWQVARRLNDRHFRDRQRAPPSNADQAQLRKLSIVFHLSRTLRAFNVDIGEQAWEQRVIRRLTTAHNIYLRPMQNNLNEQLHPRYSLQANETWETHILYPRSLEALKPIPKNLVHRTRYCVIINSTVPCDLLYDNIVPDVMMVTMPLSPLPEMAEVAIAMFAPERKGSQREPPPKRFLFANLVDHMACEGLLEDLPRMLREMSNSETARNEVAQVLHQVVTVMEQTVELLRAHLNTPVLFVSPPGMLYWGGAFQQFVYLLTEVCLARDIEFYCVRQTYESGKTIYALQRTPRTPK